MIHLFKRRHSFHGKSIIIYTLFWCYLFFLFFNGKDNTNTLLIDLLSSRSTVINKIISIEYIKYFTITTLPILVNLNYIFNESQDVKYYTLIRYKNCKKWIIDRIAVMVCLSVVYVITPFIFSFLLDNRLSLKVVLLMFLLLLNYILMCSFLVLLAYLILKDIKYAIYTYLFTIVLSQIIGILFPESAEYMIGLYGLASYINIFGGAIKYYNAISMMTIIIIIELIITLFWSKRILLNKKKGGVK